MKVCHQDNAGCLMICGSFSIVSVEILIFISLPQPRFSCLLASLCVRDVLMLIMCSNRLDLGYEEGRG